MDLIKELAIDKHQLDDEWERHPALYVKLLKDIPGIKAQKYLMEEELKITRAEFKQKLSSLEAKISAEVRLNPKSFNIEKITIPALEQAVIASDKYKDFYKSGISQQREMANKLSEIIEEEELYEVARSALEHRKMSLNNLQTLYLQEYWSTTQPKQAMSKTSNDKLKKKLKKKGK